MTEKGLCTGCGACAAVCGRQAIRMEPDPEGFLYPALEKALCSRCGRCGEICPLRDSKRGRGENEGRARLFFGAAAKEDAVRLLGSSGGIFPLLAERVLQRGGVVFGASLLEGGLVRHIGIEGLGEIPRLAKSKYVQSDLSPALGEIEKALQGGRLLLFCGTPCQTAAVRSLFGEKYRNLLTADLICYGVSSPEIWRKYVRRLERRYRGKLRSFTFRDKRKRDDGQTCSFRIGQREYSGPLSRNLLCRSYFHNVNIRPSCFSCRYSTVERESDITLGDFWGLEEVAPRLDDGRGCSVVICHTAAGKRLWEEIRDKTDWFACREADAANDRQPRLREPVKPSRHRKWYMSLYRWLPFSVWLHFFGGSEVFTWEKPTAAAMSEAEYPW